MSHNTQVTLAKFALGRCVLHALSAYRNRRGWGRACEGIDRELSTLCTALWAVMIIMAIWTMLLWAWNGERIETMGRLWQ